MRTCLAIAILVAGISVAALPGPAAGEFVDGTIRVSADADDNTFPTAGADATGRTLVVWRERIQGQQHVVARRVGVAGSLGARLIISDGLMIPVQYSVAVTPGGRAFIAWNESTDGAQPRFLRGRWVEPDDTLGSEVLLRNAGMLASAESPAAAVTTAGDAIVAWRNSRSTPINRTEARMVRANGTTVGLIDPSEGPGIAGPAVAPTATGGALVAWTGPPAVHAMPVTAAGAGGAVQTPVAGGAISAAALSTDGLDRFRIVWTPTGEPDTAATLPLDATGAAAGPRRSLDTAGTPGSFPRVATDAGGRSLAMWNRTGAVVALRLVGADGAPAPDVLTAPGTPEVQFPEDAGLLSDGTGIALWTQGPMGAPRSLRARVLTPGGAAEAPVELAAGSGSSATVVPTGPGAALVVWNQRDGADAGPHAVVGRRFLPPPACGPAAATVVQGRPVDIALPCTGPELTGIEIVTPPSPGSIQRLGATALRYLPRPGFSGTDRFTFRPLGAGGAGAPAEAVITVGRDTIPPAVRRFALTRRRIVLPGAFRVRPARRPAFVVRLGEPASLAIVIQRRVAGRWRGVGVLRRRGEVTTATGVRLARRVGRRALTPGRHRARLLATDAAGNRAPFRTFGFVVLRGR